MKNIKTTYLNILTDYGFKRIFGEESSKELLIDFLNEILQKEEVEIKELTYLKTELLGLSRGDRTVHFDLHCKTSKDEFIIVEIQRLNQTYFKDRTLAYASRIIDRQTEKGGRQNYELKAVYVIAIMDFSFTSQQGISDSLIDYIKLINSETGQVFYTKLLFVYIKLDKFTKTLEELESHFDKWLFLLRNLDKLNEIPETLKEQIFMKVLEKAQIANLSERDLMLYEESLKIYKDIYSAVEYSRNEGRNDGRNEGRIEERISIAEKMIMQHFETDVIMQVTDLSKEEIEALRVKE